MEQLPKIVGQRLQAVSRGTHLDANLLTAFAEKSLLPREQAQVMDHLAGCAVCREVVAHAQPEVVLERVAMAAAPHLGPRRPWFQGAVLRWAALAACIVVVGTVVISRARFSQQSPVQVASKSEPVMIAKTREQPAPSVSSPSAPPAQASRQKELESKTSLSKSAAVAGNKRDEDAELDKQRLAETLPNASGERRQSDAPEEALQTKDNRVDSLGDAVVASRATAGPVASPKPDDTKASKREFSPEKAMKAPVVSNEVALARAAAAPLPAPPPPPLPAKASEASLDAQQAKAEPGGLAGFYKAKDDGYVGRGAAIGRLRSDINPRWQLSAEGKLIRSGDLGKSWQTVQVADQVADKVVFRALCVADREVWVGGAQGNLFYSSDAGQHWEQVKPSANGQILTADITTIEFKDPQHGKLTTANHQAWTTSDGGHAWQVETR